MNNAVRFISYLSSGPVSPPRAPKDRRHSKVSPKAGPVVRAISLEKSPSLILSGARRLLPPPNGCVGPEPWAEGPAAFLKRLVSAVPLAVRRAQRTEKVWNERLPRIWDSAHRNIRSPSHIPRFR